MKKRILVCIRHEMMQHWFKWDINNVCWTLCIKKSISAAMFERSEESPWTVRVDYSAGAWLKAFWNPVHPIFISWCLQIKDNPHLRRQTCMWLEQQCMLGDVDALEELLDIIKLHMHSIFNFHSLHFKETELEWFQHWFVARKDFINCRLAILGRRRDLFCHIAQCTFFPILK